MGKTMNFYNMFFDLYTKTYGFLGQTKVPKAIFSNNRWLDPEMVTYFLNGTNHTLTLQEFFEACNLTEIKYLDYISFHELIEEAINNECE